MSLNTFLLVNVFLQAPSGTLLSQDEIDQILQIWTSMQRQIVSPTTMIVINEEKTIFAVKTQLNIQLPKEISLKIFSTSFRG